MDKPGLAFAGGLWDESQYVTCHADHDSVLPITADEYFDDDIVGMFIDRVRIVYGTETLEANLKFIADALGDKGNPREVIRQYFPNDFYKNHLKMAKRMNAPKSPAEEAHVNKEKIHHPADQMIAINLGDGVKVSYAKFADVLAPIK